MSSWFDSVKSYAQNLAGANTSAKIAGAANAALTVLTKPIQSLTGRYEQAYDTTLKQGPVSLVAQGALNTALIAAPFSSTIRGAVGATIAKLSPTTKLFGTGAAIVAVPYLANNPSKIPEPSGLPAAGADIPKEPSLQAGIDYIKQHPYVSGTALVAGLGAIGFTALSISSLVSNYSNTKALRKNTEATLDFGSLNNNPTDVYAKFYSDLAKSQQGNAPVIINQLPPNIPAPVAEKIATTATVDSLSPAVVGTKTTTKKKKKKAKKKVTKKKAKKKVTKKKAKKKKKTIKRKKY